MTAPTSSKMDTIALALRDALATALADDLQRSKSSRDFARRTGLDKSIGWKLWRMTTAPSAVALLKVFPKTRGVRVILDAVQEKSRTRALADEVARLANELLALRTAADREGRTVEQKVVAPALPRTNIIAQLEQGFDEAVKTQGFSLELRVGAFLLAPDAARERVDLAACTLIDGPRCYRAETRAAVYAPITRWEGKFAVERPSGSPSDLNGVPGFVPELSSPAIDASQFTAFCRGEKSIIDEWSFLPRPGVPEVLAFLEVSRSGGSIWAAQAHDFGSLAMAITAPMRRAVFDIWVHRAMPTPDFTVSFRQVQAVIPHPGAPSRVLPSPFADGVLLECRKHGLGPSMGEVSTRYRALLARGAAAIGADLADFRLFRVSVRHPAYANFIVVDWPLAHRS